MNDFKDLDENIINLFLILPKYEKNHICLKNSFLGKTKILVNGPKKTINILDFLSEDLFQICLETFFFDSLFLISLTKRGFFRAEFLNFPDILFLKFLPFKKKCKYLKILSSRNREINKKKIICFEFFQNLQLGTSEDELFTNAYLPKNIISLSMNFFPSLMRSKDFTHLVKSMDKTFKTKKTVELNFLITSLNLILKNKGKKIVFLKNKIQRNQKKKKIIFRDTSVSPSSFKIFKIILSQFSFFQRKLGIWVAKLIPHIIVFLIGQCNSLFNDLYFYLIYPPLFQNRLISIKEIENHSIKNLCYKKKLSYKIHTYQSNIEMILFNFQKNLCFKRVFVHIKKKFKNSSFIKNISLFLKNNRNIERYVHQINYYSFLCIDAQEKINPTIQLNWYDNKNFKNLKRNRFLTIKEFQLNIRKKTIFPWISMITFTKRDFQCSKFLNMSGIILSFFLNNNYNHVFSFNFFNQKLLFEINLWLLKKTNMELSVKMFNFLKPIEKKLYGKIWNSRFHTSISFLNIMIENVFPQKFNISTPTSFNENCDLTLFFNLLKKCKARHLKIHQNNFLFFMIFKKFMPFYCENIEILTKRSVLCFNSLRKFFCFFTSFLNKKYTVMQKYFLKKIKQRTCSQNVSKIFFIVIKKMFSLFFNPRKNSCYTNKNIDIKIENFSEMLNLPRTCLELFNRTENISTWLFNIYKILNEKNLNKEQLLFLIFSFSYTNEENLLLKLKLRSKLIIEPLEDTENLFNLEFKFFLKPENSILLKELFYLDLIFFEGFYKNNSNNKKLSLPINFEPMTFPFSQELDRFVFYRIDLSHIENINFLNKKINKKFTILFARYKFEEKKSGIFFHKYIEEIVKDIETKFFNFKVKKLIYNLLYLTNKFSIQKKNYPFRKVIGANTDHIDIFTRFILSIILTKSLVKSRRIFVIFNLNKMLV